MRQPAQPAEAHVDDSTLGLWIERRLSRASLERMHAHCDRCEECREIVAALARGTNPGTG